jgi:hypothetical protein
MNKITAVQIARAALEALDDGRIIKLPGIGELAITEDNKLCVPLPHKDGESVGKAFTISIYFDTFMSACQKLADNDIEAHAFLASNALRKYNK